MRNNLKLIQAIAMTFLLSACDNSFESSMNMTSQDFCVVYPSDPDCNGGDGGTNSQLLYTTSSTDGVIRMIHSNPNNPDFGDGYAKINLKNTSAQTLDGTFSVDQGGSNLPITLLEICVRSNDLSLTCSVAGGSQISFSIPPGTTGYFLVRVQADGTIPFVPFVNAIYVRLATSDALQNATLKIPLANEK